MNNSPLLSILEYIGVVAIVFQITGRAISLMLNSIQNQYKEVKKIENLGDLAKVIIFLVKEDKIICVFFVLTSIIIVSDFCNLNFKKANSSIYFINLMTIGYYSISYFCYTKRVA